MWDSSSVRWLATRLDRPKRTVSTGVLAAAVVSYGVLLVISGRIPDLSSVWLFVVAGGVFGIGYLRRRRLRWHARRLRQRWRQRRGQDDDWADESAHDWGPDMRAIGSTDDRHENDPEDDAFDYTQLFTTATTVFGAWSLDLLWTGWFVALVLGACGVVIGARLLALASPVREGMEPARRGVPACPSDRRAQYSSDSAADADTTEHSIELESTTR